MPRRRRPPGPLSPGPTDQNPHETHTGTGGGRLRRGSQVVSALLGTRPRDRGHGRRGRPDFGHGAHGHAVARRARARHRDAHGRHHLPGKNHGRASPPRW